MKTYQRILKYADGRQKGFTADNLRKDFSLTRDTADDYVRALAEHGLLTATGKRRRGRAIVSITERGRYVLSAT